MSAEDRAHRVEMSSAAGPSGSVGVWHYYAAVGNKEAKLATLVELLHTLQASTRRPLAICCSSRDSLDGLVYSLLRSRSFAVTAIHSDLTDKEREVALAGFKRGLAAAIPTHRSRAAATESPGTGGPRERPSPFPVEVEGPGGRQPSASGLAAPGPGSGLYPGSAPQAQAQDDDQLVRVLALTDVCLKVLPKELLPLGISLLVELDLPPSKEVYTRRVSALFGGGKERRCQRCVVVDMVEAGAIGAFRALEAFATSSVREMPVRVEDMFVP